MKKVFVLDTNVVLDDPDAIFKFEDNDIVIPDDVLEEVDRSRMSAIPSVAQTPVDLVAILMLSDLKEISLVMVFLLVKEWESLRLNSPLRNISRIKKNIFLKALQM